MVDSDRIFCYNVYISKRENDHEKISTQDFLKLEFKIKEPDYFRLDCVERLDQFFSSGSLTLATNCGIELNFSNVLLCGNSCTRENNVYLSAFENNIYWTDSSSIVISYSPPDITLKGRVLTEEQPGGSKLNEDGYMSVVDSDKVFFTVLTQVLKKVPWQLGTVYDIGLEENIYGDVAIFRTAQVNNSYQEEEFEEYAYEYG